MAPFMTQPPKSQGWSQLAPHFTLGPGLTLCGGQCFRSRACGLEAPRHGSAMADSDQMRVFRIVLLMNKSQGADETKLWELQTSLRYALLRLAPKAPSVSLWFPRWVLEQV